MELRKFELNVVWLSLTWDFWFLQLIIWRIWLKYSPHEWWATIIYYYQYSINAPTRMGTSSSIPNGILHCCCQACCFPSPSAMLFKLKINNRVLTYDCSWFYALHCCSIVLEVFMFMSKYLFLLTDTARGSVLQRCKRQNFTQINLTTFCHNSLSISHTFGIFPNAMPTRRQLWNPVMTNRGRINSAPPSSLR